MSKARGPSPQLIAGWLRLIDETMRPYRDGMSYEQISAISGLSVSTARKALAVAHKAGVATYARTQRNECTWWHSSHSQIACDMRRDRAIAYRQRAAAYARGTRNAALRRDSVDFERPSVHRLVNAVNAAPLRPAGPASVWELAA